jgi:uncharacterized protein (TIGR02679 family)
VTASTPDHARLRRLLGGPDTAWLVERVRRRIADGRPLDTTVTLPRASAGQRRAVELLLGRAPGTGASLTVRLAELDTALRISEVCPDGLAAAVTALTGPVPDRRAEAEQRDRAWRDALRPLDDLAGRQPDLAGWITDLQTTGLLKRLSGDDPRAAQALCASAARVLITLPSPGVSLPVLAARTTGDAHALDDGRPLAALVLSAVRALAGLTSDQTASAEGRRAAWSAVGVARDELSSRVLTLGLPGSDDASAADAASRTLAAAHATGEPLVLTFRQLTRAALSGTAGDLGVGARTVFVCENPAVVAAAADELGPACPPLVCVEGQLSAAARALLTRLAGQGAGFAYHGDFDWGGIRIATGVFRLIGQAPWRFDEASYLAALESGHGSPLDTGSPADSPWDPALRHALEHHRLRVEEEHVLDHLIADLRAAAADTPGEH